MGFPCPSFADDEDVEEDEKEKEDDILPLVLPLLPEQSESGLRAGWPKERGALALTPLELCLMVGQRGSRTHSGPGEAPPQSWLLLPVRGRSAGALRSHEL